MAHLKVRNHFGVCGVCTVLVVARRTSNFQPHYLSGALLHDTLYTFELVLCVCVWGGILICFIPCKFPKKAVKNHSRSLLLVKAAEMYFVNSSQLYLVNVETLPGLNGAALLPDILIFRTPPEQPGVMNFSYA